MRMAIHIGQADNGGKRISHFAVLRSCAQRPRMPIAGFGRVKDMKHLPSRNRQDGVALIIAMLVLLLLSSLAASLIFTTNTEIWSSANYRWLSQARYTAEAGAQTAAGYIAHSLPAPSNPALFDFSQSPVQYNGQPVVLSAISGVAANYPDAAAQSAFFNALNNQPISGMGVNANYSVTATLMHLRPVTVAFSSTPAYVQTWQITSQGNLNTGSRNVQVQLVETIEQDATPLYKNVAFATASQCGSIQFQGAASTDSYDSTVGPYAVSQRSDGGDVGSNGNIAFQNTSNNVNGAIYTPYPQANGACTNTQSEDAAVSGVVQPRDGLHPTDGRDYPTAPLPNPLPPVSDDDPTVACSGNCSRNAAGDFVLQPGNYGNLSCGNDCNIHLTAGTYNINSVDFETNDNLFVDNGPVVLNLAGQGTLPHGQCSHLGPNTTVNNSSNNPSNLQIVHSGNRPIQHTCSSDSCLLIYAPNSDVTWDSAHDLYGAVVAHTIVNTNNGAYHYDRSLSSGAQMVSKYRVVGYSWSKF